MRHGMSVRSSSTAAQLAAHLNCEFECLNCILFVANSLLQQLKANFAALHRPTPVAPHCSTAMTAGSALGFLINAAGGDIHRTWQQAAKSKQRGATSKRQGALCTELLSRFFFISALRQKLLDIFLMWGAEIKAGRWGQAKELGRARSLRQDIPYGILRKQLHDYKLQLYSNLACIFTVQFGESSALLLRPELAGSSFTPGRRVSCRDN